MRHHFLRFLLTLILLAGTAMMTNAQENTTIVIPSINVSAAVVPIFVSQMSNGDVTWDTRHLSMNVGHLSGLPWFGQGSNVVLGGHSELERGKPDVFYQLDAVTVGQEIIVYTGGQEYRYRVIETRVVNARDLSILMPTDGERLTLFTCDLGSYTGSDYSNRFVVIAERIIN